ncbi:MAG TPA: 30S ribosomal protein S16 [Candidatus Limnocylindria bacterium]|nr:30S ribosomal protein S16 [Candidatus Limnocylindria bacterium]
MAVRIRLTRVGATKRPAYRVIAIDKRRSRDGRALEILGYYDPLTDPATVQLDRAKIDAWIGKGAQPSDTVVRLLRQAERAAAAGAEAEKPKRATRAAKPKPSKKAQAKAAAAAEAPAEAAAESAVTTEVSEVAADEGAPEGAPAAEEAPVEEPAVEPEADDAEKAEA